MSANPPSNSERAYVAQIRDVERRLAALEHRQPSRVFFTGIDGAETRDSAVSGTGYGTLTTPDEVTGVVLPANGLLYVAYQALWKESVASAANAAIFLGSDQLVMGRANLAPAVTSTEAGMGGGSPGFYVPFSSVRTGLVGAASGAATDASEVTTGQIVGLNAVSANGGVCLIFAAAGTYTVSIRFKASSGTVTAKERKLWVWVAPQSISS